MEEGVTTAHEEVVEVPTTVISPAAHHQAMTATPSREMEAILPIAPVEGEEDMALGHIPQILVGTHPPRVPGGTLVQGGPREALMDPGVHRENIRNPQQGEEVMAEALITMVVDQVPL